MRQMHSSMAAASLRGGLPQRGDEQRGYLVGLLDGALPVRDGDLGVADRHRAAVDADGDLVAVVVGDAADLADVRVSHHCPPPREGRTNAVPDGSWPACTGRC